MSIRVSCVLATGNRPAFTRQAIRCFLRQTRDDSELIVVDDIGLLPAGGDAHRSGERALTVRGLDLLLEHQYRSGHLRALRVPFGSVEPRVARVVFLRPCELDAIRVEEQRDLDAAAGLPVGWLSVLIRLARSPGERLRMTVLARDMTMSTSGLTRLIDRMEAEGMVAREACAEDRRGLLGGDIDRHAITAGIEREFGGDAGESKRMA